MECLHALRAWAMVHDHLHRDHQSPLDQRTWSMLYKSAKPGIAPVRILQPARIAEGVISDSRSTATALTPRTLD